MRADFLSVGVPHKYPVGEGSVVFGIVDLIASHGFQSPVVLVYFVVSCVQVEGMRPVYVSGKEIR